MCNPKFRLVSLILLAFLALEPATAQGWQKFVSKDRSFSFHYPKGWKVTENQSSFVEVTNPANHEQLLVVAMPFDKAKTPRQLAEDMITIFRKGTPDLRASDWQASPETRDTGVTFRVKYTEDGAKYDSNVMVVKGDGQALWFSFSGPLAGYDPAKAVALLEKVAGSMADGTASVAPESPAVPQAGNSRAQVGSAEKNAKAFMFVLEFALGAPLTVVQERTVLAELQDGWKNESAEELRKFDQYPKLVQVILTMGQSDLESLRGELEGTVRQWINDNRGKTESVNLIESELKRRGRVFAAGDPPLTEMAAYAYAEITAYSELLQSDPAAAPDDIDLNTVSEIAEQLKRQWGAFSKADRQLVGTAPGLWICQRAILDHGSQADQDKIRGQIKRLSGSQDGGQSASGSRNSNDANRATMNKMLQHNTLMQIQQQTFNQYMWSRGFNYNTYGKMW